MIGWTRLVGIAAPLPAADIDTDVIFPARFLLLMDKEGLGRYLFHGHRFAPDGSPRSDFVLNRPPYDRARILVAGANFGCGSSREHAVWALADFGIRCVIAESFGEIFAANCWRNGMLPLALPAAGHARLLATAEAGQEVAIDLAAGTVACGEATIRFAIEPHHRRALIEGQDEVGRILAEDADDIARFEATQQRRAPWLSVVVDTP
jgi:3-isopropylmalate/(R)-2-methylmalate dehydratase small subunit